MLGIIDILRGLVGRRDPPALIKWKCKYGELCESHQELEIKQTPTNKGMDKQAVPDLRLLNNRKVKGSDTWYHMAEAGQRDCNH